MYYVMCTRETLKETTITLCSAARRHVTGQNRSCTFNTKTSYLSLHDSFYAQVWSDRV